MPWYAQFGCGGGGCDRIRYMKVVLQRVSQASVDVVNELGDLDPTFDLQQIGPGFLLLVGVTDEDGDDEIAWLAHKILRLRVFEDEQGKMNRSIQDIGGEILSVSQFTLFADVRKGNRPSFVGAGKPEHADIMWIKFNEALRSGALQCARGVSAPICASAWSTTARSRSSSTPPTAIDRSGRSCAVTVRGYRPS